ncbi:MAG: hypothetical protein F6K34_07405, partial [Okeania sp. SIO4D6]|uniref:hypothetical protein n=1 Tax=unclassified Okeania TaxID=2634635 RepID=UPI0013C578EB
LSSSSILRCSWILKRLGIMAIAPGNYFSPLQLYTNDATGHDMSYASLKNGALRFPAECCANANTPYWTTTSSFFLF